MADPSPMPPTHENDRTVRQHRLLWNVLFVVLVIVGLFMRAREVPGSLTGRHSFRQTQTAFTAYAFATGGIDLMHTPLPVFGPPWDVPFEMPLYQAVVVGVMKGTGVGVDVGCRLTNFLFFTASAGMFYLLAARLFRRTAAQCGVVLYLGSPLTLYWSVRGLMEFMAVFFALAYAAAFVAWLDAPRRWWLWPLIVLAGCGGALVKITTTATVVPVVLVMYGLQIWPRATRARPGVHVAAVAAMAIPVGVGQAWVWHADAIKAASPLTNWLTSASLTAWNYGTLAQRLDAANWVEIVTRVGGIVVPFAVAGFAVYALAPLNRPLRQRLTTLAVLAGGLLPIFVFFNLYVVHDYYSCAVAPMFTMLAGVGVDLFVRRFALPGAIVAVAAVGFSLVIAHDYVTPSAVEVPERNLFAATGQVVGRATPPDACVLVRVGTWDPTLLYYARRRGLMWSLPSDTSRNAYNEGDLMNAVRAIGLSRFATVVTTDPSDRLLALWRTVRPVQKIGPLYIANVADPVSP